MLRTAFIAIVSVFLPLAALGGEVPDDAEETLAACRAQIAAGADEALAGTVGEIRGWGEIADVALAMGAQFCLEIARPRLAAAGLEPGEPEAETASVPVDPRLASYLERASADGADMAALAEEIASDARFSPAPGAARDALEAALLAHARPIPAARAEANRTAYAALARIDPENALYGEKVEHYLGAMHATGRRVLGSLRRTTEEYDGSSWARHPSSPRYQDIRNYVTLYLLEDGKGGKSMELFLNYTSRDGWLFVESARLNIDGEEVRVPAGRWYRDNDSEIWEWASVTGARALELAERLANADRAVVRFYGRDFYDDHVMTTTEKRVLREMLAAWRYLEATGG